jgi:hypothetical protein
MYESELREYEALRREILFIFRCVLQLFMFAMIAVGAIFSYGITAENGYVFLIGPVIVIACVNYTQVLITGVVRIATYIRCVLEENIPGLNWESIMFDIRRIPRFRWEFERNCHYIALLAVYNALAVTCVLASLVFTDWNVIICVVDACMIGALLWVSYGLLRSTKTEEFEKFEKELRGMLEQKNRSDL